METERPTYIFVANYSGHPYDLAKNTVGENSEIVPLTLGNVNPTLVDRLAFTMSEKLVEYDATEEDYLLLSGTPVVNAVAASVWATLFEKTQLLIWDSKSDGYYPAALTRSNITRMIEMIEKHGNNNA
jgi:hypothetical protein